LRKEKLLFEAERTWKRGIHGLPNVYRGCLKMI